MGIITAGIASSRTSTNGAAMPASNGGHHYRYHDALDESTVHRRARARGDGRVAGGRKRGTLLDRRRGRLRRRISGLLVSAGGHHIPDTTLGLRAGVLLDEVAQLRVRIRHPLLCESGGDAGVDVLGLLGRGSEDREHHECPDGMQDGSHNDRPPAPGRQRDDRARHQQHQEGDRDQDPVRAELRRDAAAPAARLARAPRRVARDAHRVGADGAARLLGEQPVRLGREGRVVGGNLAGLQIFTCGHSLVLPAQALERASPVPTVTCGVRRFGAGAVAGAPRAALRASRGGPRSRGDVPVARRRVNRSE